TPRKKQKNHQPVKPRITRMNTDKNPCSSVKIRGPNPFLFPVFEDFFLPNRHGAFEFFDGPLAGLKGRLAVWGAGGDDDARLPDLKAAGAVNDSEMSDVEALVCFRSQALHLCQRHRVVRLVDQIKRVLAFGPLARVAVKRNCGAAFRENDASRNRTNVD